MSEEKNISLVTLEEAKGVMTDGFENEKALCDFFEEKIKDICLELGHDYKTHKREDGITPRRFGGNKPRIDFRVITHQGGSVLIECKNPTNVYPESINSIGQALGYLQIAKRANIKIDEVFIVTSTFDISAIEIIQEHKLPISICIIDRDNLAVWHHE